jgi:PAS domain S-box-containing protein
MNHSTATSNRPFLLNRLVNKYILAFSILALLIIAGHFLIQWALFQQSSDARIINIAGRQRMLSENLSKTALLIQLTTNAQRRLEHVDKLSNLLNLWKKSHQGLQIGNTDMELPGKNSPTVTRQFADLQPHYQAMNAAAKNLLAAAGQNAADLDNSRDISRFVTQIVTEQKAFVQQMDIIVSQYEAEATANLNQVKWLNAIIVIVTLMVLILEGLYVFRQAVRQIQQTLQDIIKAKDHIQEKETLLQAILAHSPSAIYVKDIQGRYILVSAVVEKVLKINKEDIIGKTVYDLLPKPIAEASYANDFKVLEAKSACLFEEAFFQDDGLHTYISVKFPLCNTMGEPYAICGISTDITQRKQAEEALQESEAMQRALLNAIPETAVLIDSNGIVLSANETAIQRLNTTLDKFVGTSVHDWFPPELAKSRKEQLDKVVRTAQPIHFEDMHEGRYFHNFICPVANPGKAITKVAVVATDITKYKQTLLELGKLNEELEERVFQRTRQLEATNQELTTEIASRQQTEMALKASEERYRRIVDTAQEGIWVINAKAKTSFVNQRMADMLGYSIEEIQGRPMYDFMDEAAYIEAERNFDRRKQGIGERHDFRFRCKDCSELWGIISTAPLFDEHGEFMGALCMIIDITERKQMEEQLRHSEELHHVILSSISDAIFITDDEGQFTYLCPNVNFFGFSREEMQAFGNISRLLQDNCIWLDELKRWGEIQNAECEMIDKSGQTLSLLVNMKRVSIKEGTVLYSCRDITTRKLAEQNFRQLLENAPDAMVIANQQGTIILINAQTEKLFDYTRADLLGKPVEILIPERYRRKHRHHWKNYFNDPCPRAMGTGMELYALRQDGNELPVEISLSPIETTEGILVSSTIRDITERKQAEETLRNIVEGVSATTGTNFLQRLVEHLAKILQVKYALIGQLLTDVPKTLSTLFIVADNQLIDNFEYDLRNTPCEKVITGEVAYCSCPQHVQQCFTNSLLVKMGVESCVGVPLVDTHGKVMGLIAIMDDKPLRSQKRIESMLQIFAARASAELERVHAEKALQQERASLAQRVEERTAELMKATMELARAARLKDEFLANMSHELRTPLNAILGMAEVLQEGPYGSVNESQTKSLRTIFESGHHLLSLINDILDLAKIEAGKVKLEINPVSAEQITNTCLRFIKELAFKKRLKISTTFDSAVTIVQADDRCLKQIMLNLLSNAVKFTPEKGTINLEICGDAEHGMVNFIVSDTGIGMAEKDIKCLFKPFMQLDSGLNRTHEGTGLGLSLVYRLAEMHGGCVSVESEVGKGSSFTVSLPWQPNMDKLLSDDDQHKADVQPGLVVDKLHTSAVILLVDDNPTTIETVSEYLKVKGYQVIIAYNGVQAIDQVTTAHPNLILMDIQMPIMDGLEATRRIRANAQMATIPIIALTALAMPGDKERCLEAGVNDYLSKPVSFKALIVAIERWL